MKTITCNSCKKKLLDSHIGPCTNCGGVDIHVHVIVSDQGIGTDSIGGIKQLEYYKKNPVALFIVIAITILSPFIGLIIIGPIGALVGLFMGGIAYYLSPIAIIKIIEKEKF